MLGEKAERRRLMPISSATEEYNDLKISSLTGSGFIFSIAVCIIDTCGVNIEGLHRRGAEECKESAENQGTARQSLDERTMIPRMMPFQRPVLI